MPINHYRHTMKPFSNRSVCHLLRTFKKNELREFENYLSFRGKRKLAKMWQILRKKHPEYQIDDQAVYLAISSSKTYKDNAFRVLVAELYSMVKEYIGYLQFRGNPYHRNNLLAIGLLYRGEEHTYKKVKREAEKLYSAGQPKFTELYHYHFEMEDFNYQYTTLFHHRATTDSLQKAANCLDLSLVVTKLRYLVVMYNRSRITGEQYDYQLEAEILSYLQKEPLLEEPVIHLYHLLVQLHKDLENHQIFKEFIHYYKQNKEKINTTEARQVLTFAINIAFWNIRLGNLEYLALRFALIKIMVDGQIAIVNNSYPTYHFRNIFRSAILAEEVDWASNFLEENINRTNKNDRQNLNTFCRAFLHFARGEYDKQAVYMREMEKNDYVFTDAQINAVYRLLAIKTAYQQLGSKPEGFPLANYKSQMNAFRLYIKRQGDSSDTFLLSCKNFHKALSLIFQFHHGKKTEERKALRKVILSLQPLAELPWLLGLFLSSDFAVSLRPA